LVLPVNRSILPSGCYKIAPTQLENDRSGLTLQVNIWYTIFW
jgi:hypothetical protein